jgi:kinesin family protein 5
MSEEKEAAPSEDSIRVVCRFRPLNDTEERTGSKFIVKFPSGTDDQCVSIGVSYNNILTVIRYLRQ